MKNQNAKFNLDVCMQFSPLCMGEQSYLLTKGDACWLQPIRNSHKWLPFLPAKVFFFFFFFSPSCCVLYTKSPQFAKDLEGSVCTSGFG